MSDEDISPDTATTALRAALDAVTAYGNARLGDKTLVDAFLPFVESLDDDIAGRPAARRRMGQRCRTPPPDPPRRPHR